MTTITKPILRENLVASNKCDRDDTISFDEKKRRFTITTDPTPKCKYLSVTALCNSLFEKFDADEIIRKMMAGKNWKPGHKYWGMTPDQIKAQWNTTRDASAGQGTDLHHNIECFMNNNFVPNSNCTQSDLLRRHNEVKDSDETLKPLETDVEWSYFLNFVKDHPDLKPYRTEWLVYDQEAKILGYIDMVYENPDGTLSLYDWKRCKDISKVNNWNKFGLNPVVSHLPDTNFWHYAIQLNAYKHMVEKNYGKKVKDMYLVKFHTEDPDNNYELLRVPALTGEITELFEERRRYVEAL